jgi:hypothetical protein
VTWTLSEALAELERTNPEVAVAAERYDREMWRLAFRARIAARRSPVVGGPDSGPEEGRSDA